MKMRRNAPRKYVFVFGSNEGGIHGAGAAKYATQRFGAQIGKCYGHYGDSFAIPTKDSFIMTLPTPIIEYYVKGFLAYAYGKPKVNFMVTAIGTGLAGIMHSEIAPMFAGASQNCWFDEAWQPWLGESVNYWGTYE